MNQKWIALKVETITFRPLVRCNHVILNNLILCSWVILGNFCVILGVSWYSKLHFCLEIDLSPSCLFSLSFSFVVDSICICAILCVKRTLIIIWHCISRVCSQLIKQYMRNATLVLPELQWHSCLDCSLIMLSAAVILLKYLRNEA